MELRLPRIKPGYFSAPFDQLKARWSIRLGVGVAAVVLAYALVLLFGEFYLLLFATVLLASIFGGLVPGLLVLAVIVSYEVFFGRLSVDETRRLLIEGTLVSFLLSVPAALFKGRKRLEAELKTEQQILKMEDDERRRIGRDLHDGLGQHLTGISLLSETMTQQLMTGGKPDPTNVEAITRLVSEAIKITRDLAKSLSPITLELEGLQAAVEELADTSSSLFGIHCICEDHQQNLVLDRTRSLHLFRIVQEAVNNSVRHGKAKNVRVGMTRDRKDLIVTVVDDGVGLSLKTSVNPGIGLRLMQYRAKMLGASLTVKRSAPEGGTVVTCICPLDD